MSEAKYTCHVHKDMVYDNPNECPKCLAEDAKKKAFEKDPNSFVHLSELVMAVKVDNKGRKMTFVNKEFVGNDIVLSIGLLTRVVDKVLDLKEIEAIKQAQSRIVKATPNVNLTGGKIHA